MQRCAGEPNVRYSLADHAPVGGNVTTFAGLNTPESIVSRVISRGARARGVARTVGSRVIGALAAAAILFAAQVSSRADRTASTDVVRAVSPAASSLALHTAPAHHLELDLRASARWPSTIGTPLPVFAVAALSETVRRLVSIVAALEHRDTSVVARGYDATAPPALS
jgi:hypothetical protein